MIESGIIKKVDGNYATVSVDKKDECSRCGMCLFPKNAKSIDISAKNDVGAKVGDTVVFEKKGDSLLGIFLAFIVPIVLIGISALISILVIKKEIWTIILSVLLIAIWYFILSIIDKKLSRLNKFTTKIIKIEKQYTGDEKDD